MAEEAPAPILHHRSFEAVAARPLAAARLHDRQRLAILLQGAAVLAHLEQAGAFLPHGFDGAGVSSLGHLVLPPPRQGRAVELPQDSLRSLLALLFGEGEPVGRGEAKRIVRQLAGRWRLALSPLAPDRVVGEILGAADFLWQPDFAAARQSLVGELAVGAERRLLAAGPSAFRRTLLASGSSRAELEALLAGPSARELWRRAEAGALRGRGPAPTPAAAADVVAEARRLTGEGQYEKALHRLEGDASGEAESLRLHCQVRLGRLGAAAATLRRLEELDLPPALAVEVAEAAVRLAANQGRWREVASWAERVLAGKRGKEALTAHLVAAVAATDLGLGDEAWEHLEAARPALSVAEIAWRWQVSASLHARLSGDFEAALKFLSDALKARRELSRMAAAEVWNDIGVCRAGMGDLAGAERAFLHTVRLLATAEGPRATTLALSNLGETRLRRGRLPGVRDVLEHTTTENRLSGNLRGQVQDLELWARFELAHGRLHAAVEHCRAASRLLAEHRISWRRGVLAVLSARALGWMGKAGEAAEALREADASALAELEPEEVAALFALAGDRERALIEAQARPFAGLWRSLLLAAEPPAGAWAELSPLEPYRAARLVYDADLVAPGLVPIKERRRAVATFRSVGASALAERLEAADPRPWEALATYLAGPPTLERWAAGLAAAGLTPLRLKVRGNSAEALILPGPEGGFSLEGEVAAGTLVATAAADSPELRAFFSLALRDLGPGLTAPGEAARESRPRGAAHGLVGTAPALTAALDLIEKLAPHDLPILILGESGTGKELAARLVHQASGRRGKSWVAINCAAVSESLLLSDLFGHVRGAFTGADRDRAGVFEAAQGGTVFLDEIGDLPAVAQGMLLRVLQEGEVRRVGESLPRRVDVRVVAATHRDLGRMVGEGSFRQDLFFRLKVAQVTLPPLRERPADIPLLAAHFLAGEARGRAAPILAPAAAEALLAHGWPGNVRELKSVLAVAAALAGAEGGRIEIRHLNFEAPEETPATGEYQREVDALRRRLLTEALAACGGNRAQAARRVGMTRQAFSYLLKSLKIA